MRKLTFLIIAAICSACDIYAEHSLSIDNQTNDTIRVVFLEKSPYKLIPQDDLIFPPLHKKHFYYVIATAGRDGCSYTGIKEGETMIYCTSGRKIRKAIWNVRNWDCSGSFRLGWEQTFVITEDDLE